MLRFMQRRYYLHEFYLPLSMQHSNEFPPIRYPCRYRENRGVKGKI